MKRLSCIVCVILTVVLLVGCTPTAVISPTPTPSTVVVHFTPAARPVSPALNACDVALPGVRVETEERFASQADGDLLILAEWIGKRSKKLSQINWLDALVMGIFQVVSLFPGVSRSGSTITGGMLRELDRPAAARFSFLMSVPVMVGAGILAAIDLFATPGLGDFILPLLVGFFTAAVVGYLSIHWLLRFLANHPLHYFSIYLIALTPLILVLK